MKNKNCLKVLKTPVLENSCIPPTIIVQPISLIVDINDNAIFSVAAQGTSLRYQWKRNNVVIANQTIFQLNIAQATLVDDANYTVTVYNDCGSVTSDIVSLSVNAGPCIPVSINVQPISRNFNTGDSFNLTVGAAGTSPVSYQWRKDGVDISGQTTPTLSFTSADTSNQGSYDCVLTNACGTATSNAAVLTLSVAILGYYYAGDTDYFAALNGGTDAITYNGTFTIINGNPLLVPFASSSVVNKFIVVKYPDSQSVKTHASNTPLNQFDMPDSNMRDIVSFGGNRYVISRTAISLDTSFSPNLTIT